MQVKIPSLRPRCYHSAATFNLSPEIAEVTIFGGCPEWPSIFKTDADVPQIADTTVLRFGESPHVLFVCWSKPVSVILAMHTLIGIG